jgi:hypothetical protein
MPFPTFDTADAVPEAFRDQYEEHEGKWVPKDDGAHTALVEERTKREAAEKLVTKTAKELKAFQTKQQAADQGLTDAQLTALRESIKADLEAEYTPKLADRDTLAGENRALKLDREIKTLMADAGVRAEKIEQTWKLYGDEFDLTTDGKPMVKATPGTEVKKFITDTLKARVPEFFAGTQAAGGGAAGQQNHTVTASNTIDPLKNPSAALQHARATGATE